MEGTSGGRVFALLEGILGSSPSEFIGKTCSVLMRVIESSSQEGELLIYMFGLKLGEKVGREIREGDPWSVLSEVLSYMGLAESIHVVSDEPGGTLLRVRCTEKHGRKAGCSFVRGIIAGFISQASGRYVLVTDVECRDEDCLLRVMESLENVDLEPPRDMIMEYLRANPGAHMRQIARDLGMSLGSLRWHLSVLERRGLVKERRKGNMTEFYPAEVALKYYQNSSSQGTS